MQEITRASYDKFRQTAVQYGYLAYQTPVREVCNSVISILKNGFAGDFVVCMFQSFCELLAYLQGKMKEEDENRRYLQESEEQFNYKEQFDYCFSAYFEGLSSLVNSAMHTDRQFTQTTSFGAIFYDVPPKLMAFYVAVINRIKDIMKGEEDNTYTFLITPGFSDEISVKIISYSEEQTPRDRILKVLINERSLYNPGAVMRRMAHEIAHYVGDNQRKRYLRKQKIAETYVNLILQQIFHTDFANDSAFRRMEKDQESRGSGKAEDQEKQRVREKYSGEMSGNLRGNGIIRHWPAKGNTGDIGNLLKNEKGCRFRRYGRAGILRGRANHISR